MLCPKGCMSQRVVNQGFLNGSTHAARPEGLVQQEMPEQAASELERCTELCSKCQVLQSTQETCSEKAVHLYGPDSHCLEQ